jgi:hypothetical protein
MQRYQIMMYQNISFEVKKMEKEDLLAEKRDGFKIPANGVSGNQFHNGSGKPLPDVYLN